MGKNALITCGHGFGWGNGRGLVEVIGYHTTYQCFLGYFVPPALVHIQCLINAPEPESLMSISATHMTLNESDASELIT